MRDDEARATNPGLDRHHWGESTTLDAAEHAAVARHEVRRWLDCRGGHLARSLVVAVDGRAWRRVRYLADRLVGVGLVGELADAELRGDCDRVRELELTVRARRRAA